MASGMNTEESDNVFLKELISRMPASPKICITLSKGTIPLSNEDSIRLVEIAKRRGKVAKEMLEEML